MRRLFTSISTSLSQRLTTDRLCSPLSKTVRFNVLSVVSEGSGSKKFSKF